MPLLIDERKYYVGIHFSRQFVLLLKCWFNLFLGVDDEGGSSFWNRKSVVMDADYSNFVRAESSSNCDIEYFTYMFVSFCASEVFRTKNHSDSDFCRCVFLMSWKMTLEGLTRDPGTQRRKRFVILLTRSLGPGCRNGLKNSRSIFTVKMSFLPRENLRSLGFSKRVTFKNIELFVGREKCGREIVSYFRKIFARVRPFSFSKITFLRPLFAGTLVCWKFEVTVRGTDKIILQNYGRHFFETRGENLSSVYLKISTSKEHTEKFNLNQPLTMSSCFNFVFISKKCLL